MNQLDAIQRIEQDFEQNSGPFADVEFPETRLVRELKVQAGDTDEPIHFDMEERARIAAIFCTFDYNRNANQLVDNLLELQEKDANLFDPWHVRSKGELKAYFEDIGFRYPNRDANGWYKNCEILRNQYNGRVTELMLSVSSNAPDLVEQLNDDDFLYLKGAKIAPMFARILNDEVAPLDGLWELDIPADTHIIGLTEELTDTEMNADDTRTWWQVIGEQGDISRHIVDGAMWQIGNNWQEWGQEYFAEVTGKDSFEYM
jgi:hypothetical protein